MCPAFLPALAVLAACTPATGRNPGDAVLVTYVRSGGIAGDRTSLTVTTDGAATVKDDAGTASTPSARRLPADQVDRLRSALDAAAFDALHARYPAPGTCNDCFLDVITYRGRSVTVEGAAAPARLSEALGLLEDLAAGG
jgi:hypothetical protein